MISNNAYYELFASYTVPDHNRVGYWVDLGANSKGKVIKTYNENLKKWVKVTDATSEDAVAPFIGNNGNWWIDNRDTGIHASGHSPYIGHNGNWFVHSSERNEHIDTGLPSRGEAGPKGDKGDKGNDATINGVGSIKIEAGDNITITQSDDTLTIIGDVQKPDLSNYATKTEVTNLNNKLQDAVSSVFRAKGSVKTYNNLPVDSVSIGDVYNVSDTGANYVAISINPITWDKLSETVDLSKFFNKEEINSLLSTKVDKQEGKQLTTEDFTTVLKRKLEGLSNYNDTEIRNAIDSLESAFNTLVEGNATVAIDTFNEIVSFLKNIENSQDLDSIIAGINTTISKVEAKIPDTNNFLSKDGGTMNNTNLVGNLNAELLNGYSSDKFVSIINHITDSTTTDALTVGLNTINQDYLWTNTPYGDIATLVDISYSPDWRSLFFISPSTGKIHTRFKHNGDSWSDWKRIMFDGDTAANSLKLNGISSGYNNLSGFIPVVGIGREMEIGSYLDFHLNGGEEKDYSTRLVCSGNTANEVNLPLSNGTLALISDTVAAAKKFVPRYITNLNTDGINEFFSSGFRANNRPSNENYATGFTVYNSELAYTYQFTFDTYGYVYTRYKNSIEWKPWRRLAFTDDPVAAANKLSTTRYIWGQPFDGSGNVNGVMNFLSQGNLITAGGESWANNIVLSIGYDTTNGDWTKLGVAGEASNSAGLILTQYGRVGIGVDHPTHKLHINGAIKAEYNSDYSLAHDIIGETHFYNDSYSDPATNIKATIKVNGVIAQSSGNVLLCTTSGNVGINTTTPQEALDVNGSSIFRNNIYVKNGHHIFLDAGKEGVYYTSGGLSWHNAANDFARRLISFSNNGNASFTGSINMDGSDQINGIWDGVALNYNCGKYVNTAIWDGQARQIMRVFGEGRQVAIGAHSIDTPRGTLNVDGEVIFEKSRFTTTSGFIDDEYAYFHAIYGGYHGIDVCEFYENEFRFKTNGGDITSFKLNSDHADFNGAVRTHNRNFVGLWNGRERFRLVGAGEYNTWLQAATDTTDEGGRLFMSGMYGTHLSEFNVLATTSNFKGSIIAEGDVTAYSDIRLKNRIETVSNVLDTINNLDVFRYTWKNREDKSVHIGVSAQQVQTIYPEFVLTSSSEDGTDYLTVNYAALATCIAIQGIKELVKKGDERDKRIAALEGEVISLKEQLRYGNK